MGAAMRHAVFPGGARIRPRLCLSVARACSPAPKPDHQDAPIMFGAASAIELLHCASLVHDDLPCFDDAAMRRGKPSVHVAFDERLAVLAGDALIVMAFEILAVEAAARPERLSALLSILARSVGMPLGIAAGQAWECEPHADLSAYQQAKTGALFAAASLSGAVAVALRPIRGGAILASVWARLFRWPMIFAMWRVPPSRKASRWARMMLWVGPMPPWPLACRARLKGWNI
nr:polyprenyl synthetase family protein [Iodidimonas nitroreducens]